MGDSGVSVKKCSLFFFFLIHPTYQVSQFLHFQQQGWLGRPGAVKGWLSRSGLSAVHTPEKGLALPLLQEVTL